MTVIPFPVVRLSDADIARHIADIHNSQQRLPFQVRADDRRRVKLLEITATDALLSAGMSQREIDARVRDYGRAR